MLPGAPILEIEEICKAIRIGRRMFHRIIDALERGGVKFAKAYSPRGRICYGIDKPTQELLKKVLGR